MLFTSFIIFMLLSLYVVECQYNIINEIYFVKSFEKSGTLYYMKQKLLSALLALTGLTIIGVATLHFLGLFNGGDAGLLIDSDPVSTVYINGHNAGQTPYEATFKPGELLISIRPTQQEGQVLDDYETKVALVSGIKTIINRNFNENNDYTSGLTVSFEKISGDESLVTVISAPDNAKVLIDNKVYGYTPVRLKIPAGSHNLELEFEGYIKETLPIESYKGYKLTAAVKLAKDTSIPVEPEIATVLAETVEVKPKIRIDENQVGFLRVRSGANTGFPEIARVLPGEEYEILEEGEHGSWFKIQLPDVEGQPIGRQGWVSAEFVTKI